MEARGIYNDHRISLSVPYPAALSASGLSLGGFSSGHHGSIGTTQRDDAEREITHHDTSHSTMEHAQDTDG